MKCPGQDTQFWKEGAIFEAQCPQCSRPVEFFKDDTTRKCGGCGHRFINPRMDFGCAAYCPYAEQCLGDMPPELVAQKADLLKERVAVAVKRHLKTDFKRIGRAGRRAWHAEQICPAEQGNLAPVLIAAYLWDLDTAAGVPGDAPMARAILSELKAPEALMERVVAIIGKAGRGDTNGDIDGRVVADAAAITDLEEALKPAGEGQAASGAPIESLLRTERGKTYARELFTKLGAGN
jgi:hypothetical protein